MMSRLLPPGMFDFEAKLVFSQGHITDDEFYNAIPSAYRYFKDYLKAVHEIDDENSWGGKAYLTRLEVPEETPDVFGNGYVIHPGILDSITQCGPATFADMDMKQFDFNGVSLPVQINALCRWDSHDAPDLDAKIRKDRGICGPLKSDYIIVNSEGPCPLHHRGL